MTALYIVELLLVLAYVLTRERMRILVTSMTLAGIGILYGFGFLYYSATADLNDEASRHMVEALSVMWLMLILGIEMARALAWRLQARANDVIHSWTSEKLQGSNDVHVWSVLGVLIALFLVAVFIATGKPGQLADFWTLATMTERRELRAETGGAGGYLYQLTLSTLAPFVALGVFACALACRRMSVWIVFAMIASIVLLCKIATFHRAQWIWFVLQIALAMQLSRSLQLGAGPLIGLAAVLAVGVIIGSSYTFPDADIWELLRYLVYRVFEISNEGIYQTLYVYPYHLPHTHGLNVALISTWFGVREFVPAHVEVAHFFGAEDSTFNAFFIADAWVDFGIVGVAVASFGVGYVVKMYDLYALSFGKGPVTIALLAASFFGAVQLLSTSALTALMTGGLGLLPLIVLVARSARYGLRRT